MTTHMLFSPEKEKKKKSVAVFHRSNLVAFFVFYMIRELKE